MASKTKKRKRRGAKGNLFEGAQRALAKGNCKQAYKDAKVCYRQEPTEEHRVFFQRVCLARAKELVRNGFREESRAVVGRLMDLGPAESGIESELPGLLASLGMLDRLGGDDGVADLSPELLATAADEAVLRPGDAPCSPAMLQQQSRRIRQALAALESGDEARAMDRVRQIPRHSPFADWKLFVRGLAAYYRGATAQMEGNWSRLDPDRPAARIAARLRVLDGAEANPGVLADPIFGRLERAVLGSSVCSALARLQRELAAGRFSGCVDVLKRSQRSFARFSPELLGKVVGVVASVLIRNGAHQALASLEAAVDPPPMDPNWNRAWALAWEHPDEGEPDEARACWENYVADLEQIPGLTPAERRTAQALVWHHIGLLLLDEYSPWDNPFVPHREEKEEFLREEAIECFQKSLERDPTLCKAYEAMAAAYHVGNDEERSIQTLERLLEHHPNYVDVLLRVARHYQKKDEPFRARELAERARTLKPANPEIQQLVWQTRVASARHYALQGRWEKARGEFDQAARLPSDASAQLLALVCRGLLELKARNVEEGERLIQQARACCAEPTPALLAATVESIRYDLSATAQKGFERQWRAALKNRTRSETAGRMCQLMAAYCDGEVEYPDRHRHEAALLDYLRRCGRLKWHEQDLLNVCLYLEKLQEGRRHGKEDLLLGKLASKGVKRFPKSFLFHVLLGELEMRKGPGRAHRDAAERAFRKAVDLYQEAPQPKREGYYRRAQRHLQVLEKLQLVPPVWTDDDGPFPLPESVLDDPDFIRYMIDKISEVLGIDPEDLSDDDEEDGEPDPRPSGPRRRGRKSPPKRQRAKRSRK